MSRERRRKRDERRAKQPGRRKVLVAWEHKGKTYLICVSLPIPPELESDREFLQASQFAADAKVGESFEYSPRNPSGRVLVTGSLVACQIPPGMPAALGAAGSIMPLRLVLGMGHPNFHRIDPDELPIWGSGDETRRELFELVRDRWFSIRQAFSDFACRSVAIIAKKNAEGVGDWAPPLAFLHRGEEYGIGDYPDPPVDDPRLLADLEADPRHVLITVIRGDVRAQFVFHLDHGPPGVKLTGGDRPKEIADENEWLAEVGEEGASLLAQAIPLIKKSYHESLSRGLANPVALVLDLRDKGARQMYGALCPGQELPKAPPGDKRQAAHITVGHPVKIAKTLHAVCPRTSKHVQESPPPGYVWTVLVANGRTKMLATPRERFAD